MMVLVPRRFPRAARTVLRAALACHLLGLAGFVSGCGGEGAPILNAVGSYSDVAIVTDLELFNPVAFQLEKALELPLEYSLKPENLLEVDIFDMRNRKKADIYKNVIVLGFLNGKDSASREIQGRLAGEEMKVMGTRGMYIATRTDVYAQNQNVLFLAGNDRNAMSSGVVAEAPALRGQIEGKNRQRVLEHLLAQGRNVEAERQLVSQAGFRLTVPAGYKLNGIKANEDGNMGCAEVVATGPTRSVVVFWRDVDPATIDLEDTATRLQLRRDWGVFLEERLQDLFGYTWTREIFRGEEWPMLAGLYEVDAGGEIFGGPFRTVFVLDGPGRRLYGVNWLAFRPHKPKHVYMREVQAIAETFAPRS